MVWCSLRQDWVVDWKEYHREKEWKRRMKDPLNALVWKETLARQDIGRELYSFHAKASYEHQNLKPYLRILNATRR
jgi:hypothetical protein